METKQGERALASASQSARVAHLREMAERGGAKGVYRVKMTLPSKSDLPGFLRVRELVARLEMQAVVERARSRRIELYEQLDESRILLAKVPQIVTFEDEFRNVVATLGKNVAEDAFLGTSYAGVGPFCGLISSTSFSAVAAADTMTSHAGWLEAGNANAPTYTSPRKTPTFSAAAAGVKAFSATSNFAMTGSGTVKGVFLVFFTSAVTTIDSTAGTLLSAGLFTGGDQPTVNGNSLQVSWQITL